MKFCMPIGTQMFLVYQHGGIREKVNVFCKILSDLGIEYSVKGGESTPAQIAVSTANKGIVTLRSNDFVVISKSPPEARVYTFRQYQSMFYHQVEFYTRAKLKNDRTGWKRVWKLDHNHKHGEYIRPAGSTFGDRPDIRARRAEGIAEFKKVLRQGGNGAWIKPVEDD